MTIAELTAHLRTPVSRVLVGLRMEGSALVRRWPLVLALALAPLLLAGLFARDAWTPDEPRELALSWNMAQQAQKSVPSLAGEPFCEKPPLTYWLAGASMSALGKSVASARLPSLFYALAGAFALALLARAMLRQAGRGEAEAAAGAFAAGAALGTMELTAQVQIWLACDAPLLAGTCIALLGAWQGLQGARGRAKLLGYSLMHAGLLLGFFSKGLIAFVMLGTTALAFLAWERRWNALRCWELYVPLLLQATAIGAWVAAVATQPHGDAMLRQFFVDNSLGRFLATPTEYDYARGHRNWPGKYFVELPYYLLPWTALAFAAARRAWRRCRGTEPGASAWRFAVAVVAPNLLLLSVSATARGIYFAPPQAGFALLLGLWLAETWATRDAVEQRCVRITGGLLALFALGLPVAALGAALWLHAQAFSLAAAGFGLVAGGVLLHRARHSAPGHAGSMLIGVPAYVVPVAAALVALSPVINGFQSLQPVTAAVAEERDRGTQIAVYHPDETITAVLEYQRGLVLPGADDDGTLREELAANPALHVLARLPDSEGAARRFRQTLAHDFGLSAERDLAIPHGRHYLLLARSVS